MSVLESIRNIKKTIHDKHFRLSLEKVSRLEDIPESGLKDSLKELYTDEDTNCRIFASILNMIYTQKTLYFMLLPEEVKTLVESDPNHDNPVPLPSGKRALEGFISRFRQSFLDHQLLTVVHKSTGKKRANIYAICNKELLVEIVSSIGEEAVITSKKVLVGFIERETEKDVEKPKKDSITPPKEQKPKLKVQDGGPKFEKPSDNLGDVLTKYGIK